MNQNGANNSDASGQKINAAEPADTALDETFWDQIHDADPAVAIAAIEQLHGRSDKKAVIELAGVLRSGRLNRVYWSQVGSSEEAALALRDKENKARLVCVAAVEALASCPAPGAWEALCDLLNYYDAEVRAAGMKALAASQDPRALAMLVSALQNWKDVVRYWAVRQLGERGERSAIPDIMHALQDQYPDVRSEAVQALARMKADEAFDALRTLALKDYGDSVRHHAVGALAEIGGDRLLETLIEILRDAPRDTSEYHYARGRAAGLLGGLGDLRTVEPLIKALGDPDEMVRACSARSLGELKDRRATASLMALLRDPDEYVRLNAAEALGELGDPAAVEALKAAVQDENDGRTASLTLLCALEVCQKQEQGHQDEQRPNEGSGPRAAGTDVEEAAVPGEALSGASFDELVAALADEDEELRVKAVHRICKFDGPDIVDPLIRCLSDPQPQVRLHAAARLGEMREARALYALVRAAAHGSDRSTALVIGARREAIRALGQIGDPHAVAPLIVLLREACAWAGLGAGFIIREAARALTKIGDRRAVEPLREALAAGVSSNTAEVIEAAIQQLKGQGDGTTE